MKTGWKKFSVGQLSNIAYSPEALDLLHQLEAGSLLWHGLRTVSVGVAIGCAQPIPSDALTESGVGIEIRDEAIEAEGTRIYSLATTSAPVFLGPLFTVAGSPSSQSWTSALGTRPRVPHPWVAAQPGCPFCVSSRST